MEPRNPQTTQSLLQLADLFVQQGRYAEAEPLYQRVLSVSEQRLGDHPDTAILLAKLADVYRE
jgi:hypothetical protein